MDRRTALQHVGACALCALTGCTHPPGAATETATRAPPDVQRRVSVKDGGSVPDQHQIDIDDEDVNQFAEVSGDTNPLHLDEEFAAETMFSERIVHGMLLSSLISAALARLPGVTVYLSQNLEFHNPAHIDDHVTAECEIVEDLGNGKYRLSTHVVEGDDALIHGEAIVLIR